MDSLVYILLASYNGEKYIERQLDSIISQSYSNWSLLIRDDGSSDATLSIIERYCQMDSRINLISENCENEEKGACQNFATLIKAAVENNASYIMFCDQDDYWFSNKVELMLQAMISNDSDMVYSNFKYSDENLIELPNSIQESKSPFLFPFFRSVMVQNQVYGCTMMIKGKIAKKCLPIPSVAENHDYWITLVVSGINAKIYHLKKALMLYRQHESNVTGSFKDHNMIARIKRFLFSFNNLRKIEYKKILMLKELYKQLNADLAFENKKLLEGYFNVLKKNRMRIIFYCINNKIKRQSFLSTIVYYIVISKVYSPKILNK